jgi:hypothetical protein
VCGVQLDAEQAYSSRWLRSCGFSDDKFDRIGQPVRDKLLIGVMRAAYAD